MEELDYEAKHKRKLEAKRMKRDLIESSGGKRPRPAKSDNVTNKNSKKNKRSNQMSKKGKPSNESQNRFGRVMEQVPCTNTPRKSTLSIALPGSIVSNAQTMELRTHLVGQIARAAAIYHVDEIVIFNDQLAQDIKPHFRSHYRKKMDHETEGSKEDKDSGNTNSNDNLIPSTDPHIFMARILQYCECPQYLRRQFFGMHPDLQFAGLLSPLDAPHHVREGDRCLFREGVVYDKTGPNGNSVVNCGIRNQLVEIDRVIPPGIRCTVKIEPREYASPGKTMKGVVVSPSAPREHNGAYWGYTTRIASSIKAIFDECPYPGGYDLKIGTSERGDVSVDDGSFQSKISKSYANFKHSIIILGGVSGIEECVDADETMDITGNESKKLFDVWVNICQYQGSRTIRTEEAVMISLSRIRPLLFPIIDANAANRTLSKITNMPLQDVIFSDHEDLSDESSSSSEE